MYMKFQKIDILGDSGYAATWTKNIKNAPKVGFYPISDQQDFFFKDRAQVTFVPLWRPNFLHKIEKTNGESLKHLKRDKPMGGLSTDGQG